MFKEQSILGKTRPHPEPRFDYIRLAEVTSTRDYKTTGKIEVKFVDGGATPVPARVFQNGVNFEIFQKDVCLVGFVDGNKNEPCVICFLTKKYKLGDKLKINEDGTLTIQSYAGSGSMNLQEVLASFNQRLEALEEKSHSH